MTLAQLLISKLDQQLPKMIQGNGYDLSVKEIIKGFHPNYSAKSDYTIFYQLGNEKPNYISEDGNSIASIELPFALIYKGIVGKGQGKIIDVQEQAIFDLRRFINGDKSINEDYTLPKAVFSESYELLNKPSIQRIIPTEWERFPDINQCYFFAVVMGSVSYIEDENNINLYQSESNQT